MAESSFPAWTVKADSEAPRGGAFHETLTEALEQNEVTHWSHLLEVEPGSLRASIRLERRLPLAPGPAAWQAGRVKALVRAAREQKGLAGGT
eukprot:2611823-Pyramimonas_sp.AAC.1